MIEGMRTSETASISLVEIYGFLQGSEWYDELLDTLIVDIAVAQVRCRQQTSGTFVIHDASIP